jgi:hypothetical protein
MYKLVARVLVSFLFTGVASAQDPLFDLAGKQAGDRLGHAVARVGDIDGDTIPDWVAGAPYSDQSGSMSGSVVAYSGLTGNELYEFIGDSGQDFFGYSVAGGDVNGDGAADVIVGAYANDATGVDAGTVYVFSGLDGGLLWSRSGDAAGDNLGFAVAFVPDVDGDGLGEVLAGAWTADSGAFNDGEALLLDGSDGTLLQTWNGESAYDFFGASVAGLTDVDGDGFGDVLIGAFGNDVGGSGAGAAYVYSGASGVLLYTWRGDNSGDRFGTVVGAAGDVDGDGKSDLFVGAPGSDFGGQNAGLARVYSGATGLAQFTFVGAAAGDNFGSSLAGGLDVTEDGIPDLFVGSPAADPNGASSGQVRVFSGADGSLFATIDGQVAGARFGASLAGGGDVNSDGVDELLVGAWGENLGTGAYSGAMHVLTFVPIPPSYTYNYCVATPNSTGQMAQMSSLGTTSVSLNDFTLVCTGVVPNSPGLFFYGPNEAQLPFGNGFLCVAGASYRLPPVISDSNGRSEAPVDFTSPPDVGGTILSGSIWKFQNWYRDAAGVGFNFNLSDGLSATFVP